jgi:hypothetical protein
VITVTDTRRAFLSKAAKIATGVAAAAALPIALAGPASAARTGYFRFCTKCFGLMFQVIAPPGGAGTGVCPTGAGHTASGYTFSIPYDVQETANAQANWRLCRKCDGLFWRGYPTDGVCPAGNGHDPGAPGPGGIYQNYVLTHDVPASPTAQDAWRFCVKCYGLFFFGYSTNGRCPAGNEHKEAGYNFVLDH